MSRTRGKRIADQILWHIIASPLFGRFRTRICHINYCTVEGKTKGNRHSLRSLVFGSDQFLHYLTDLVYHEGYQIRNTGKTALHEVISVAKKIEPDIMFAEFHWIFSGAMSKHFLVLPDLTWNLDVTPPLEILVSKMKRTKRKCIREIEEKEYAFEYTDDLEELRSFHNKMYLPYISKVHANSARLVSMTLAEKMFRKGGLLLVKSEGQCVSGILFSKIKTTLQCALLAIDPAISRGIAGQAALYGLIKWAKKEGCTEIEYGETSPFVSDGLFEFKRTWGMQVKPLSERAFGIRIQTLSDGALDFLATNPLVFRCLDDLGILVLLPPKDVDPKALYRRYYTPGLSRLVAIHKLSTGKIHGMSPPDNLLEKSFTNLLPLEELQKMNYRVGVLTFGQSNAQGNVQGLKAA